MKIVINEDFGGFSLSNKAIARYLKLKGIEYEVVEGRDFTCFYHKGFLNSNDHYIDEYNFERNDPALIQVVEELGEDANGRYSSLKIIEIPDDVDWYIGEYDGREHVAERHRTWS